MLRIDARHCQGNDKRKSGHVGGISEVAAHALVGTGFSQRRSYWKGQHRVCTLMTGCGMPDAWCCCMQGTDEEVMRADLVLLAVFQKLLHIP